LVWSKAEKFTYTGPVKKDRFIYSDYKAKFPGKNEGAVIKDYVAYLDARISKDGWDFDSDTLRDYERFKPTSERLRKSKPTPDPERLKILRLKAKALKLKYKYQ
jgi:hypothetical protein